jgi:hypothetical protein
MRTNRSLPRSDALGASPVGPATGGDTMTADKPAIEELSKQLGYQVDELPWKTSGQGTACSRWRSSPSMTTRLGRVPRTG